MKSLFKASIFLGISVFVLACKLVSQSMPSPVFSPSPSVTAPTITSTPIAALPGALPTLSFSDSTATLPAVLPTQSSMSLTPTRALPTFLPTIATEMAARLLGEALSVQTMEGANGHSIRRITGWEYGFQQSSCCAYHWLDASHLLLYPRTGEVMLPHMDGSIRGDLSSQPAIVNLESGHFWFPHSYVPTSVYFSQKLGIVFLQDVYGTVTGPTKEAVITYTLDGKKIARYWGKILGVSPKGTKVLVDDDTIIDLRAGKMIDLAWHMDYDLERSSNLYWSTDETRVYRCCFYYADLKTGESYNFEWSDLRGVDGKSPSPLGSPHVDGQWVRNDTYFFPKWDYWSYARDPFLVFSPSEKKYHYITGTSISPFYANIAISPDGLYAWISGILDTGYDDLPHGSLVNLTTFEVTLYDIPVNNFEWSPDSKFGLLDTYSDADANGISHTYLLSVADKKLEVIDWDFQTAWRPADHVLADLREEGQVLRIFHAKDKSMKGWQLPTTFGGLVWSPNGERIALIAKDGSLWQADYPRFEHPEQLTGPLATNLRKISWSPDGNSIAFISGSDIYIVDTMK